MTRVLQQTNSVNEIDANGRYLGGYVVDFKVFQPAQQIAVQPAYWASGGGQNGKYLRQDFSGKLIKSHAKYFSQQNSPINKS